MNKNEFKKSIQETFNDAPDVLTSIKNSPRFHVKLKEKKSFGSILLQNRFKMSFVSVFVIAIILFTSLNLESSSQVYASSVTIDINPSIEIKLDEDDLVMEVIALNDDGETLIEKNVKYSRMSIEQVVNRVLDKAIEFGYLDPDELENVILLHVESKSEEVKLRVQTKMVERIETKAKKHLPKFEVLRSRVNELPNEQQDRIVALAAEHNVSVGKMVYILQVDRLDNNKNDDYTLEELIQMNMRNLRRIEKELGN